jgi:hypothetical protein
VLRVTAFAIIALTIAAPANAQARKPAPADQPAATTPPPAATPADGRWRGQSSAGSCGQTMDVAVTVEGGLLEGTARETAGKAPLLWSYHGRTRPDGTVQAVGHASAFPPQQAKQVKLSGRLQDGRLTLAESDGCGRTATLSRG